MSKWVRAGVLDNGLNDIKTNAVKMLLVSAYAPGDSYATLQTRKLAEVSMVSGDYALANAGGSRTLTTAAGKSATASASAASPDLHIAFTDGAAAVIWVTDETSDQAVNAGDTVTFPSLVYTAQQPT